MSTLAALHEHRVQWVTAAPLWRSTLASDPPTDEEQDRMHRPTLLRFTSDEFMEELAKVLADEPEDLGDRVATPVSFRSGPPGKPASWAPPMDHLKLYQPIHGHFNLVVGTLVCRLAGLPDRAVDQTAGDVVGFVLRRLDDGGELAWDGSSWLEVDVGHEQAIAAGEQVQAMFPVAYNEDDGRRRRLFAGLIPTSSLESFKSGTVVSLSPGPGDRTEPVPDRRLEELDQKVIDPLDALERSMIPAGTPAADLPTLNAAQREQKREASLFLLLDLADFLDREVPLLWQAILEEDEPPQGTALRQAYRLLEDTHADPSPAISWGEALRRAWAQRDAIFGEGAQTPALEVDLNESPIQPATLRQRIQAALPPRPADSPEPQPPFEVPKFEPRPGARYVVRCVYRRPQCGPLHPDVVSDASEDFAIASLFDIDAPARPIHISLPIDTSIAGLRKAPKNVTFMLSKELRQQMSRVVDLKKTMDGKLGSGDSFELGMICSFSIPIITICALIVLTIFVALLNIVFWWMPFLRICFPIPLKAKV